MPNWSRDTSSPVMRKALLPDGVTMMMLTGCTVPEAAIRRWLRLYLTEDSTIGINVTPATETGLPMVTSFFSIYL